MLYRGFPSKLRHEVPDWVPSGAIFHIRISLERAASQPTLITPSIGEALLESARFYDRKRRWYITVFMLMPDHIHALLSFARDESISLVIGDWKHYQTHHHQIR